MAILDDDWEDPADELLICSVCQLPGLQRINDKGETFCPNCGGSSPLPRTGGLYAEALA